QVREGDASGDRERSPALRGHGGRPIGIHPFDVLRDPAPVEPRDRQVVHGRRARVRALRASPRIALGRNAEEKTRGGLDGPLSASGQYLDPERRCEAPPGVLPAKRFLRRRTAVGSSVTAAETPAAPPATTGTTTTARPTGAPPAARTRRAGIRHVH